MTVLDRTLLRSSRPPSPAMRLLVLGRLTRLARAGSSPPDQLAAAAPVAAQNKSDVAKMVLANIVGVPMVTVIVLEDGAHLTHVGVAADCVERGHPATQQSLWARGQVSPTIVLCGIAAAALRHGGRSCSGL